jgi:hypothetical protein
LACDRPRQSVCPTLGKVTGAAERLYKPCGRLVWAGEHACMAFFGYMESALQSGMHAAQVIAEKEGIPEVKEPAKHVFAALGSLGSQNFREFVLCSTFLRALLVVGQEPRLPTKEERNAAEPHTSQSTELALAGSRLTNLFCPRCPSA